ncbi:unnamed protein product [Ceratitis capitata]|uniref:(Mediterranean fruit fly) hypothetical protein n=1 Tax=Ceratitis capitata TaxID=7213 RepID=A0A811UWX5_CERCA|nr:unnamed protein product [Ceratitis capitata]
MTKGQKKNQTSTEPEAAAEELKQKSGGGSQYGEEAVKYSNSGRYKVGRDKIQRSTAQPSANKQPDQPAIAVTVTLVCRNMCS